jgi:hypothetical protein
MNEFFRGLLVFWFIFCASFSLLMTPALACEDHEHEGAAAELEEEPVGRKRASQYMLTPQEKRRVAQEAAQKEKKARAAAQAPNESLIK